jgi:hypothetical protein
VADIKSSKDLEPLRGRADFKKLLADLETNQQKKGDQPAALPPNELTGPRQICTDSPSP